MKAHFLILKNSSYRDGTLKTLTRDLPDGSLVSAEFRIGAWGVLQHETDDKLVAQAFAFASRSTTPSRDFSVYNLSVKEDRDLLETRKVENSMLALSPADLSLQLLLINELAFVKALTESEKTRKITRHEHIAVLDSHLQRMEDSAMIADLQNRLSALEKGGKPKAAKAAEPEAAEAEPEAAEAAEDSDVAEPAAEEKAAKKSKGNPKKTGKKTGKK